MFRSTSRRVALATEGTQECFMFNVSLDIPKGGACYRRDARMSYRGRDGQSHYGQNRKPTVKFRHYNINILFIYSEQ